jgi:hypothetical protein
MEGLMLIWILENFFMEQNEETISKYGGINMLGSRCLKYCGVVTLFFFVFFIASADFVLAKGKEDSRPTASRPYQQGDGEEGIGKEVTAAKSDNVIEQPAPAKQKRKKKFPVLLVVGGAILLGVVLVLVLGKKKDEEKEKEPVYDIRDDWKITLDYYEPFNITFSGAKASGTFVDSDGYEGTYRVNGYEVEFSYNTLDLTFTGIFSSQDYMVGDYEIGGEISGQWVGHRGAVALTSQHKTSVKTAAGSKKKIGS